ncbi:glutamate racemase [Croceicoccus sp. F390]|uniref:Glutamate racemase n=1 Tax=Croceicoccus esteveae TaxID=3075597 RepID=A0ABU2ZIP6_9SPHN|nr:glutamate racemase [Croceicoccus sp. F390]MDT0575282.1 glutamate racemase [Croceicoccus sp. F390]
MATRKIDLAPVRADAPILVFDSGIGGLSVLDAIRRHLPGAPVIYAADNAGFPYGIRTEAEIAARVAGLLGRIAERFAPRLACIACNTASTIALGMVREVLHIPIVGTVPAIKPAATLTRTGIIGLVGTEATIRQPYVDQLKADFAPACTLIRVAAPQLVVAAEEKLRGRQVDGALVANVVNDLRARISAPDIAQDKSMDVLILACTHFPLLAEEFAAALGPQIRLVDGADGIARRIAALTKEQQFSRSGPDIALFTGADSTLDDLRPELSRRALETIQIF